MHLSLQVRVAVEPVELFVLVAVTKTILVYDGVHV